MKVWPWVLGLVGVGTVIAVVVASRDEGWIDAGPEPEPEGGLPNECDPLDERTWKGGVCVALGDRFVIEPAGYSGPTCTPYKGLCVVPRKVADNFMPVDIWEVNILEPDGTFVHHMWGRYYWPEAAERAGRRWVDDR